MLLCIGFGSCSDDGDDFRTSRIVKATVQNAEYIYKNSQENLRNTYSQAQAFWTADKYGTIAPIQFITEKGDTIDMQIDNISDVNEKYLLMSGAFHLLNSNDDSQYYQQILTDKTTGLIYGIPNIYINPDLSYTDKFGNIYWSGGNMVYKVDTSNPNNLVIEEYIPKDQDVSNFLVNRNGLCCIIPANNKEYKFKTKNGRIYTMSHLIGDSQLFDIFIGFDDAYYIVTPYILNGPSGTRGLIIYKVIEDSNNELTTSVVSEYNDDSYFYISCIPDHKNRVHIMSNGEKTLTFNERTKEIKELSIKLPKTYRTNGYYYSTSSALYLKENTQQGVISSLIKLDLNDYSVEKLDFMGNGYEAYLVSASIKTSGLSFSGLRFSDGKNIIGNVDAEGNFSVFENIHLASKATNLIRLN